MKGCCEPGRPVYLSVHDSPRRKLGFTWELIDMPASLVGVNTMVPNRLVHAALIAGQIPELAGYTQVEREVKISGHSRIDLSLTDDRGKRCYVEIKNCTLVENQIAQFPDAVTARGLRHIRELEALISAKCRCVMFYFIQRMDAVGFKPADHIDAAYGRALRKAIQTGMEIIAYDVSIDLSRTRLNRRIRCEI
jgi:sugar fermentation stimulation protein A